MPPSHAQRLAQAARLLQTVTDTPRLDAEILLAAALGITRARLLASMNERADAPEFAEMVRRRLDHEPIAYILGEWEFFSLDFIVRRPLLVPRPETEHLVEAVLEWAAHKPDLKMLELGVGTGCVSVSVAVNAPDAEVLGTDINPFALEIAAQNAAKHHVANRMTFRQGDLFAALQESDGPFDAVCSNPPYIEEGDWEDLSPVIRKHEDVGALLAGPDGLDVIRRIVKEAPAHLVAGGLLAFEIGMGQDEAVAALLRQGPYTDIGFRKDLAGINRIACASRRV